MYTINTALCRAKLAPKGKWMYFWSTGTCCGRHSWLRKAVWVVVSGSAGGICLFMRWNGDETAPDSASISHREARWQSRAGAALLYRGTVVEVCRRMSRLLPAIARLELPRFCHHIWTWFLISFRRISFFPFDRQKQWWERGVMGKKICMESFLKRFWWNGKEVSECCQFFFFFAGGWTEECGVWIDNYILLCKLIFPSLSRF
jgi:hypothetical protein